jgi:hypothetical protein
VGKTTGKISRVQSGRCQLIDRDPKVRGENERDYCGRMITNRSE